MHPSGSNEDSPARRKLLGSMVSAAALLGLNATGAASAPVKTRASAPPAEPQSAAPEELFAMARLRSYKTHRSSSWDRTGGNDDWVPVEPGQRCLKPPAPGWSPTSGSPSTRVTRCT